MAETVVSDVPDPEKPVTHRILPDLSNVNEFYHARYDGFAYNGRLDGDGGSFLFLPDPPPRATVGEIKHWRARVRAGIVRPEEIVRSIPAAVKEKARVKLYECIFGWLLVEGSHARDYRLDKSPANPREDVDLFI